jgi:hypothetical protein
LEVDGPKFIRQKVISLVADQQHQNENTNE